MAFKTVLFAAIVAAMTMPNEAEAKKFVHMAQHKHSPKALSRRAMKSLAKLRHMQPMAAESSQQQHHKSRAMKKLETPPPLDVPPVSGSGSGPLPPLGSGSKSLPSGSGSGPLPKPSGSGPSGSGPLPKPSGSGPSGSGPLPKPSGSGPSGSGPLPKPSGSGLPPKSGSGGHMSGMDDFMMSGSGDMMMRGPPNPLEKLDNCIDAAGEVGKAYKADAEAACGDAMALLGGGGGGGGGSNSAASAGGSGGVEAAQINDLCTKCIPAIVDTAPADIKECAKDSFDFLNKFYSEWACTADPDTKKTCFETMTALDDRCMSYWGESAEADCKADAKCEWINPPTFPSMSGSGAGGGGDAEMMTGPGGLGGFCDSKPTKARLDALCSKCALKLTQGAAGENGGGADVEDIASMRSAMCAKVDGEYCAIILDDAGQGQMDVMMKPTKTALDGVCTKDIKLCTIKMTTAMAPAMKKEAQVDFQSCLKGKSFDPEKGALVDNSKEFCLDGYTMEVQGIRQMNSEISQMCAKNGAGDYCMTKIYELSLDDTFQNCGIDISFEDAACSDACDKKFKTVFDDMGCCFGLAQQMIFAPGPNPVPPVGYTGPTLKPVPMLSADLFKTPAEGEVQIDPTMIPAGSLVEIGKCASLNATEVNMQLSVKCGSKVVPIKKSMSLKIAFSKIKGNDQLYQAMLTAVRADVAGSIGLSEDEIQNDRLLASSSVVVTTSMRRMRTLAEEAGTDYEFEIASSDPDVADKASGDFDTKSESGDMSLTNTADVATSDDCTGCTASSVNGSSLTASLFSASGASSQHVGVTVAAAVAAFLAVIV